MKHTVDHVTLNNPHDYQCRKYQWWCMQGCKRYVKGECQPNYPVPAIPNKIDLAEASHWYAVAKAFQKIMR